MLLSSDRHSQARSKSNQIQPSRAKPAQRQSKKPARFSLDFLVRFEPFQGLARTPWPGNIFDSSLPVQKHRAAMAYARARDAALLVSAGPSDVAQVIHHLPL